MKVIDKFALKKIRRQTELSGNAANCYQRPDIDWQLYGIFHLTENKNGSIRKELYF